MRIKAKVKKFLVKLVVPNLEDAKNTLSEIGSGVDFENEVQSRVIG